MFHAFFADSPNRAIAVLENEQLVGWLPEFLNDVAAKGIQRKPTSVVGTTGSTTVTPKQRPWDGCGNRLFREVWATPATGSVHDSPLDTLRVGQHGDKGPATGVFGHPLFFCVPNAFFNIAAASGRPLNRGQRKILNN